MSEHEEQWIDDCRENPMYAASHIMQLQAENAALKFELRRILEDYGLASWHRKSALALLEKGDE
jgi:hypothetical protein